MDYLELLWLKDIKIREKQNERYLYLRYTYLAVI